MTSSRLWLGYLIRRAGKSGIVGLALLISSPWYYWAIAQPYQDSATKLHAEYDVAIRKGVKTKKQNIEFAALPTKESFYSFFPIQREALGWIGNIYAAADQAKLQLAHGEYRQLDDKDGNLTELQIILPVKGSYNQIRYFIGNALENSPFIALDEVSFKAAKAQGQQLEARIRFTLFTRKS